MTNVSTASPLNMSQANLSPPSAQSRSALPSQPARESNAARGAADAFEAYAPHCPPPTRAAASGGVIEVGPDDTLWSIAGCRLWMGATAHQIVASLVRANPDAFEPDRGFGPHHKRLKPETTRLILPPAADMRALDNKEAADICASIVPGEQNLRRLLPEDQEWVFGDDTLERIAKRLDVAGATLNQKMVALFEANPTLFDHGNMNHLERAKVITMPKARDVLAIDEQSAASTVSDHRKRLSPSAQHPAARIPG